MPNFKGHHGHWRPGRHRRWRHPHWRRHPGRRRGGWTFNPFFWLWRWTR